MKKLFYRQRIIKNNQRKIDPAVYNERRMREQPLAAEKITQKNPTKRMRVSTVQPIVLNSMLYTPPSSPNEFVEEEDSGETIETVI